LNGYFIGVDWADEFHQIWVGDAEGKKITEFKLIQSPQAMAEFGRWLNERRAEGIGLWGGIEKPQGRIVEFLLDHGVVVYPINPKALDRVRDRYRVSGSKSDTFDAYVLAEFVRTDHAHLRALEPSSVQAQELKLLTRDHYRLVRHKTRILNLLNATLKEYYPRPLEVFGDLETQIALDFLERYPTPQALSRLTKRQWNRFAQQQHPLGEERTKELWNKLAQPQLAVPEHVVRTKAQLLGVLISQLRSLIKAVDSYGEKIECFFALMPAARLVKTLPGGKSGTIVATLWAELGDAKSRWESFRHLQAEAGVVPVTKASGKCRFVQFRFSCNKLMRYAAYWISFVSLNRSHWAKAYYRGQRAKGHSHHQALRALSAKWLKIFFVMWRDHKPYDEAHHLANIARQTVLRPVAKGA
jgi:transposase